MEKGLSLSSIGAIVSDQLKRMDIVSGEGYLTGVASIIEPLQERLNSARDELWELVANAAAAEDTDGLRLINDRTVTAACALFEYRCTLFRWSRSFVLPSGMRSRNGCLNWPAWSCIFPGRTASCLCRSSPSGVTAGGKISFVHRKNNSTAEKKNVRLSKSRPDIVNKHKK